MSIPKHNETIARLMGVMEVNGVGIQGSVSGISNLSPRAIEAMELYCQVKKIHEDQVKQKSTCNDKDKEYDKK